MNPIIDFLLFHIIFLLSLFSIFYFGEISSELVFSYKAFFSFSGWKSILFYLYGKYGFFSMFGAYGLSIGFILFALLTKQMLSQKILFINSFLPIYGSVLYFLLYSGSYFDYGFFGEVLGGLLVYLFGSYSKAVIIVVSLFLVLFIFGFEIIFLFFSFLYLILKFFGVVSLACFLYKNFIDWVKFFFKRGDVLDKSNAIEKLIYEIVRKDFYDVQGKYALHCDEYQMIEKKYISNCDSVLLPPSEGVSNLKCDKEFLLKNVSEFEKESFSDALNYFGITFDDMHSFMGPRVNTFIITPSKNIKLQKIYDIFPDFNRILGKQDAKAVYPLRDYPHSVGFEYSHGLDIPIYFSMYAYNKEFLKQDPLDILLGVTTSGKLYFVSIIKAPHILLAGTTGSGKSSIIQTMITSLIWRNTIEKVKLVLIDPKKSEFYCFARLPHLLFDVAYEIDEIDAIISSIIDTMNSRYKAFNETKCKNIAEYNELYPDKKLPFIIVFIDEYADIVLQSKPLEKKIIRILQMSRAAGIHFIVATQRPSIDIINSSVKSNLPVRISCKVTSAINSRIIVDTDGAEKLLGNGDMILFDSMKHTRIHGLYVTQEFLEMVIDYYK